MKSYTLHEAAKVCGRTEEDIDELIRNGVCEVTVELPRQQFVRRIPCILSDFILDNKNSYMTKQFYTKNDIYKDYIHRLRNANDDYSFLAHPKSRLPDPRDLAFPDEGERIYLTSRCIENIMEKGKASVYDFICPTLSKQALAENGISALNFGANELVGYNNFLDSVYIRSCQEENKSPIAIYESFALSVRCYHTLRDCCPSAIILATDILSEFDGNTKDSALDLYAGQWQWIQRAFKPSFIQICDSFIKQLIIDGDGTQVPQLIDIATNFDRWVPLYPREFDMTVLKRDLLLTEISIEQIMKWDTRKSRLYKLTGNDVGEAIRSDGIIKQRKERIHFLDKKIKSGEEKTNDEVRRQSIEQLFLSKYHLHVKDMLSGKLSGKLLEDFESLSISPDIIHHLNATLENKRNKMPHIGRKKFSTILYREMIYRELFTFLWETVDDKSGAESSIGYQVIDKTFKSLSNDDFFQSAREAIGALEYDFTSDTILGLIRKRFHYKKNPI